MVIAVIPDDKTLLIDAIVGAGFPSIELADRATKRGLAEFTGNQWNEAWSWKTSRLAEQPPADLLALYTKIKELQRG